MLLFRSGPTLAERWSARQGKFPEAGKTHAPWVQAIRVATLAFATSALAGTVYVTSEKDDAVTMIDTATLAVKGTIPTCKRKEDDAEAAFLDAATGKELKSTKVGQGPRA